MKRLAQGDLVGRWRLVSWEMRLGEQVIQPMGPEPQGMLIYTASGWMAIQAMAPGRRRIDSPDPIGGSEAERADAYAGSLAYSGHYEVTDDAVVHRIELSSFPNWIGDQQLRRVELEAGELTLRTPPIETPGGTVVNALRWARVADV